MTLLFSYGSNHPAQLKQRLGRAVETQAAFAQDYQRVFRGYSNGWGGGVATIVPMSGSVTYGLVVEVTKADLALMDRFEGVASGNYKRVQITVSVAGRPKKVVAYVSMSHVFHKPTHDYLKAVAKTIGTHWRNADGKSVTPKDITIQ